MTYIVHLKVCSEGSSHVKHPLCTHTAIEVTGQGRKYKSSSYFFQRLPRRGGLFVSATITVLSLFLHCKWDLFLLFWNFILCQKELSSWLAFQSLAYLELYDGITVLEKSSEVFTHTEGLLAVVVQRGEHWSLIASGDGELNYQQRKQDLEFIFPELGGQEAWVLVPAPSAIGSATLDKMATFLPQFSHLQNEVISTEISEPQIEFQLSSETK